MAKGSTRRDSVALMAGTIVNGLLAYVFFAVVTQRLGAERAAPVAVLWTYWGAVTAVLTFPIQHWIIRTVHATGEGPVKAGLRRLWPAVVVFSGFMTVVTWLVREPLFLRDDPAFPILVALLTLVTFFGGVVRGGLAGRRRFVATASLLGSENLVRLLLAVGAFAIGGGAVEVGVALVVGGLVGLVWPSAYRFSGSSAGKGVPSTFAFLGAIATGSLIAQVVLVGGPAALSLLGGSASDVTSLFVTLALFRAPYLLGLGLANQVTGWLTSLIVERRRQQLRSLVAGVGIGAGSVAIVGGLAAHLLGPPVIGLIFGTDTAPRAGVAAIVAAGSVCAVGNLTLSLLAVAYGRGAVVTRAWLVGLGVTCLVVVASPLDPLTTVSWAFLSGEVAAFAVLWFVARGWTLGSPSEASIDNSVHPGVEVDEVQSLQISSEAPEGEDGRLP